MTALRMIGSAEVLGMAIIADTATATAQPVKIRQGHSQGAEENLWLMDTAVAVAPNRGKAYQVEFIRFRGADERFKAYEAFFAKNGPAVRAYLADFVTATQWYLANQVQGPRRLSMPKWF